MSTPKEDAILTTSQWAAQQGGKSFRRWRRLDTGRKTS